MHSKHPPKDPTTHDGYGNFSSYVTGFILCIILTLISYFLVAEQVLSGWTLIYTISFLALLQAVVQLVFFLHIGSEPSPYWNLTSFLFMFLVLVIIVAGTLWIMHHLNYAMVM